MALALDCDHANALNNRALTLAALGRTAEALASWGRALEIDPDHFEALTVAATRSTPQVL